VQLDAIRVAKGQRRRRSGSGSDVDRTFETVAPQKSARHVVLTEGSSKIDQRMECRFPQSRQAARQSQDVERVRDGNLGPFEEGRSSRKRLTSR
jgi:hypothetical protein